MLPLPLRLAWRNAWRNTRRTGIVVSAVAVGIAGTLLSMAINFGMIFQMIETAITTELGHVQVHARGWDANPEPSVRLPDGGAEVLALLRGRDDVRAWAPRVRGEGLISSTQASVGVRVIGIEPERETQITVLADSITRGAYLDGQRRSVLIGEGLAKRLGTGLGAKVVLSAQDLAGDLTGEALRVVGVFRTPSSELDRSTVFLRIGEGQKLLGLDDAISELVVVARSRRDVAPLRDALARGMPGAEVRSWDELQPLLVYIIDVFDQTAWVTYAAIFIAMAFGIANVLLMTVFERTREIGIMTAVGFGRARLVTTVALESLLVTLVGVLLGFAGALLGAWLLRDGIDLSGFAEGLNAFGVPSRIVPVLRRSDFSVPLGVAVATALLASIWPAVRAVRMRSAEAVRQT